MSPPERVIRINGNDLLFGRKPTAVPGAYWRRIIWMRVWTFLYTGLVAVWSVWMFAMPPAGAVGLALVFLLMVIAFGGLILLVMLTKRIKKRLESKVRAFDYKLCLQCGFPLVGLPGQHTCPECGQAYEVDQLRREWELWHETRLTTASAAKYK